MGRIVVVVNPAIVCREEDDDWAILYNPDTAEAYGLNPTAAQIFKSLDGERPLGEVVADLIGGFRNVPDNADALVCEFVERLVEKGIAECRCTEAAKNQ